jgi:uncharacterized protein YajQ (UPF0234 family)
MSNLSFPTEVIELPSKGLVYPESNPLSSGKIEMKYMTAREEDILTNQSYIKQGIVLDKLLQSLIVSKINYNDLLIGDKNAVLIASRILGYGKDYSFTYRGEEVNVDLTQIENKTIDESLFIKGKNEFEFKVPSTSDVLTFKLLTINDENKIDQEVESLKKIGQNTEKSTRLKHMITSINGNTETKSIRDYVDNYLLAKDALALRTYINKIQPDVNLTVTVNTSNGPVEGVSLPIGLDFFWPDFGV